MGLVGLVKGVGVQLISRVASDRDRRFSNLAGRGEITLVLSRRPPKPSGSGRVASGCVEPISRVGSGGNRRFSDFTGRGWVGSGRVALVQSGPRDVIRPVKSYDYFRKASVGRTANFSGFTQFIPFELPGSIFGDEVLFFCCVGYISQSWWL